MPIPPEVTNEILILRRRTAALNTVVLSLASFNLAVMKRVPISEELTTAMDEVMRDIKKLVELP